MTSWSESETAAFAKRCANTAHDGDIFALFGPLGAGKSVFARSFIQYLIGDNIDVPSPTFTLVQTYESPKGLIRHFDLYRIENPQDVYEIGWEEAMSEGITLVEWPERLETLMPAIRNDIIFEPLSSESRKITLINDEKGQP